MDSSQKDKAAEKAQMLLKVLNNLQRLEPEREGMRGRAYKSEGIDQPRPQGLLAFQNGGGSGEDPGTPEEVGHGPDCIMGQILNFAHLTETVAP